MTGTKQFVGKPRTFLNLTRRELVSNAKDDIAALHSTLVEYVNNRDYYIVDTNNSAGYDSETIWTTKMKDDSHYYVFYTMDTTTGKNAYIAHYSMNDANQMVLVIFLHVPEKRVYDMPADVNRFFLLSRRVETNDDIESRLSIKGPGMYIAGGSFVAVYNGGGYELLYSSETDDVFKSSVFANSNMVPSPSPGPSTSSAVIAVTPQPGVLVVTPRPGAQQLARPVAQPVAQSNDGPTGKNGNDGTNGTPVPTFSTSTTALSCAEVTAQYNVSGSDKVECVSSTGATPVSSVTLVIDAKQVTLPTVGLEKKDGKWVGFASVGSAQWIWVEITGKKMKYKVQFESQDWETKEVEVKDEKDKKFKFEGGTVEYSGQNPFEAGSVNVGLIVGITLAVLALVAIAVGAALLAARRNRKGEIRGGSTH
jgi:hypothetical protein